MTCMYPMTFRIGDSPRVHRVPCGRCLPCRIARSREWQTRMLCEQEWWPSSSFVTLTYDDPHLPTGGTLVPSDLQLWVKRIRRRLEPRKLRFFGVGEYGTDDVYFSTALRKFVKGTERPHYHAIMFGVDPVSDKEACESTWPSGHVVVGTVTPFSVGYVAKYCVKKLYGEEAERVYGARQPPFSRMSQGLGRDWCDARAEELRLALGIMHRGKEVGLPRYFARRLGITEADTAAQSQEYASKMIEYHRARFPEETKYGLWFDWPSVRRSNLQSGLNAEARLRTSDHPKL